MTRADRGAPGTRLGWLAAADERPAVVEPGRGSVSYAELDKLADRVAARLRHLGVEPGARVGIYLRRSADAIAAMLGALRAGCTYVPVDPAAPVERNAEIHFDCGVCLALVEERFAAAYREATTRLGASIGVESVGAVGVGRAIGEWAADSADVGSQSGTRRPSEELALILYTSGSTGRHKGWMMTRAAIEAHARWCHQLLQPGTGDVFANHAPFSFGMSLFDIYSSLGCGAALVLVPDEIRAFATHIVDLLSRERVTIWFSGPAILSLIGALEDLEARDLSALRVVAFAGEVFPAPRLRPLRQRLPRPRYFNFYGSTETNVAAYYELPPHVDLDAPAPIGRPCAHYEARVVSSSGETPAVGAVGELQFRGIGLTTGYINQSELTAERIIASNDGGLPWYRTCDLAVTETSGDLRYVGRIGRMVKLRGYRVEPGEIEARLYQNPHIKEAAVVPIEGPRGMQLVAHVSGERRAVVELKAFCSVKLPAYMIPERFVFHTALPRTARGKIDFEALRAHSSLEAGA